ncbi:hypothetical protein H0Z60_19195 [Ectothiorhodospiraceae bacterium WFHF3C12]|nr:hypothetical protein [Ectothiorhodospiraceae bacterium WFHF3C12]
MTDIALEFELADSANGEAMAEELKKRLAAMEDVEAVDTMAEEPRTVAEIVAIVAAGVVLIDHGTSAVSSLAKFVRALRELMQEVGDLKKAYIEIRGKKVDVTALSEEEIESL